MPRNSTKTEEEKRLDAIAYNKKCRANYTEEQKERERERSRQYRAKNKDNWKTDPDKIEAARTSRKRSYEKKKRELEEGGKRAKNAHRKARRAKYNARVSIPEEAEKMRAVQKKSFEKRRGNPLTIRRRMLDASKTRAKKYNLPHTITLDDIILPKKCPVLNMPLALDNKSVKPDSPSLDKIVPHLGYVPGNVVVISHRANSIKSNAMAHELRMVADWIDVIIYERHSIICQRQKEWNESKYYTPPIIPPLPPREEDAEDEVRSSPVSSSPLIDPRLIIDIRRP